MWNLQQTGSKFLQKVTTFTQVRTATKRAAGSRTSMKDSAGRRLGPKKFEGQQVKTGEIIFKQRGTKFYPGENVGIGRDHTIFAAEPGFVRYYLDPFHPERRFIGVSLHKEAKLPTPHFEPRVRRFGRVEIVDPVAAKKEEKALPRKAYLIKDEILAKQTERAEARSKTMEEFKGVLSKLAIEVENPEIAAAYLLRYRNALNNGFTESDAQHYSETYLVEMAKLQGEQVEVIKSIAAKLNTAVAFDSKSRLTAFKTEAEKAELKAELLAKLKEKMPLSSKADKKEVIKLLDNASAFLTKSEEVELRRRFNKSVLSETVGIAQEIKPKTTTVTKRWNYEAGKVDMIVRENKKAFTKRL